MNSIGYLLGFPTPIAEVFLTLVVLFLVVSLYLGTQMTGTKEIRRHGPVEETDRERVNDR